MTTLSQLQTSVDSWLARDDVAVSGSDWPQILLLAESDIARDVRCAVQETTTTLNFTGRSVDLPVQDTAGYPRGGELEQRARRCVLHP